MLKHRKVSLVSHVVFGLLGVPKSYEYFHHSPQRYSANDRGQRICQPFSVGHG